MASGNRLVSPPPGWTMDPEELDYEGEWAAVDSWGYRLATSYELGKCTPIMCDPQGGGLIFEARGKFYMVNQMSGEVVQIILPETLGEIVAVMKGESRRKTLKTRLLGSTAYYESPPTPPGISPADPGPVAEIILPAFNAQLDLRAAYRWDRPEILEFLRAVVQAPAIYGVDPQDGPELDRILQDITALSAPNGGWQTLVSTARSSFVYTGLELKLFSV